MTAKNLPVAIGFATITTVQLVFGMWATALAARKGGKVGLLYRKSDLHSQRPPFVLRSRLCSRSFPADIPRRVPLVYT